MSIVMYVTVTWVTIANLVKKNRSLAMLMFFLGLNGFVHSGCPIQTLELPAARSRCSEYGHETASRWSAWFHSADAV